VNCFVTEPIRYTERGVAATSSSRSAFPHARIVIVSRPRTSAIATLGAPRSAMNACASESVTRATAATGGQPPSGKRKREDEDGSGHEATHGFLWHLCVGVVAYVNLDSGILTHHLPNRI